MVIFDVADKSNKKLLRCNYNLVIGNQVTLLILILTANAFCISRINEFKINVYLYLKI